MRTISLCITSYNRCELTIKAFEKVIDDPRIMDIVIVDDGSDAQVYTDLRQAIIDVDKTRGKVSLFHLPENQGVYKAKLNAISLAFCQWCILLDSDNVIDSLYLDKLYEIPKWDPKTSYLPDFARPTFDYRNFGGHTITPYNVSSYMEEKMFDCLINTMNGFYNKDQYQKVFDMDAEPMTMDSMYMNYLFLLHGNSLQVVKGLQYDHLIHPGSHYKQHCHKNLEFRRELFEKYKSLV